MAHLHSAHFWCWIKWWMGFVLGLVCLIIADIIGQSYSHSPPPSLHSSNNQIWCWEKCSQARKEERHSSEQGEKKLHNSAYAFFFVCLFWGGGCSWIMRSFVL